MKFFNSKEEVIDIELTPYGKYLLSKGKFKPYFYAFFDDGVLYDSQYGGTTEETKDVQNRIKSDTPRLKAQGSYSGAETNLFRDTQDFRFYEANQNIYLRNEILRTLNPYRFTGSQGPGILDTSTFGTLDMIQQDEDKFYSLKYAIGTSDLNTNNAPAWNVTFLRGNISSSSDFLTGAFSSLPIPQIKTTNITYETYAAKTTTADEDIGDVQYIQGQHYIDVIEKNGELILDISEDNVFFGEGNFDIEVYTVEDQTFEGNVKQVMTPLYFTKEESLVENGILKDVAEIDILDEYPTRAYLNTTNDLGEISPQLLDPSYVEYFLAIDIDHEIDRQLLCELTEDKTSGIFGERFLNCEDTKKKDPFNTREVFDTDVEEGDIIDCE